MKRSTRGCGCAVAVLVLLLGAGAIGFWKFGLPWWHARLPKPTGELQVHVLDGAAQAQNSAHRSDGQR